MAGNRRTFLTQLLLLGSVPLSGCGMMRNLFGPRDPFAPNARCVLRPDATSDEVLEYLNDNTGKITSWRSDSVSISGRGAAYSPVSIGASLAIESPRNFRLLAKSLTVEEVDLGSNPEEYWFWSKRSEEKYIFVAHHGEEISPRRRLPIPFQPDWIMEVFGVMPIDGADVTMHPGPPGNRTMRLVAQRVTPDGTPVQKVVVVDTCHGVVREHQLLDSQGQLIASARLEGHFRDPKTQVVLPSKVSLDWPRADVGLTLVINRIEVNPPVISEATWRVPTKQGYAVQHLSQ
ncbi:MAG: hypothetical protein ACKV0T_01760 [Planctomycetales bacterium]